MTRVNLVADIETRLSLTPELIECQRKDAAMFAAIRAIPAPRPNH